MVLFSMNAVPIPVRVGLAVLLSAVVLPVIPAHPELVTWEPVGLAIALGGEAMLGVFLGMATRILLAFIEIAGTLIGINAGLAVAMQFDPMSQGQALVVTRLVQITGLLVFLAADLHHEIFLGLFDTFVIAPPGAGLPLASAGLGVSAEFGRLFLAAVRISMPVIAAVLFLNVVAALVTRFAQQMNVYFSVGLSLNAAVGLMVAGLSLGAVAELVFSVGMDLRPMMRAIVDSG
jgi:flagellar biosynthetic protein FliR